MIVDAVTLVSSILAGIATFILVLLFIVPAPVARVLRLLIIPLLLAIAFVDWICT